MIILVILAYSILGIFVLLALLLLMVLVLPLSGYSQVHIQDGQFNWTWRLMVLFNSFGVMGGLGTSPRWIVAGRERQPKSKPQKASPDAVAKAPATDTHAETQKAEEPETKHAKRSEGRRFPPQLLWTYRRSLLRFLKRLFSTLHLQINGNLTLGLEDPAWVGMLCGSYWALLGKYAQRLYMRWNYVENVCEGQVTIQAHIRLVEILWVVIRFAWELPLIRIWRAIKKG
ncbi:DUF2953 domain-containing protein [Candidatus Poribacteria bacterium]|nr:DUF2953 domain-containing protein [Candidatus Poribacteria bacterium]